MVVIVEIEQDEQDLKLVEAEIANEEAQLIEVVRAISEKSGIPVEELVLDLGVGDVRFQPDARVADCLRHGHRWRHRRVCIDLHFESEEARHTFPARATWSVVHKWGCHRFQVPHDACANLELHEASPKGPVLNDHVQIGDFKGCKTAWLVKPGPEPYGRLR
ncbi:MAG: hypothetical protein LAO06_21630 [Acidobacteriia bacterium]|nr:hypothetical protein [Terriglobia bacterium]